MGRGLTNSAQDASGLIGAETYRRFFADSGYFALDPAKIMRIDSNMSKKPKAQPTHTSSERSMVRRGGRPLSQDDAGFYWYREVNGFEKCDLNPWWSGINWADDIKARKARRSIEHRTPVPRTVLAGFLWEALRRLPDLPALLAEFGKMNCEDIVGEVLPLQEGLAILAERQQALVRFLGEDGMLVVNALTILSKNWKLCFENLPQESKDQWEGCYSALWHKVGEPGSVPAAPAELPATEPMEYWGQGGTAFDLLIKHKVGHFDPKTVYEDFPVPSMFLRAFAKLVPSKGAAVDPTHPHSDFAPGKTDPCTYPWLSFGILERHLGRYHLHPLALAVDLSKSTEIIVRDLKKIIEEKRRALGICVADRRIKKESFDKIKALDQGVFGSSGTSLLARTVKEFKASAQLDLKNLIHQIGISMDPSKSETPQKKPTLDKEVKMLLDNAMRQPR